MKGHEEKIKLPLFPFNFILQGRVGIIVFTRCIRRILCFSRPGINSLLAGFTKHMSVPTFHCFNKSDSKFSTSIHENNTNVNYYIVSIQGLKCDSFKYKTSLVACYIQLCSGSRKGDIDDTVWVWGWPRTLSFPEDCRQGC